MLNYLSGRSKKTPQSALSSERYRYLSVGDAEPNLADPPGESIPIGQQYQVISVDGFPGKRYWLPVSAGLIPGSITIYDEGSLVGGINSTNQLNFVGAAISAQGIGGDNPGTAVTITVFAPGNTDEILFNQNNDFSTSSILTFNPSSGLFSAGNRLSVGVDGSVINTTADGFVGIGTTLPTSKFSVKGTSSLENLTVSGVSTFNNLKIYGTLGAGSSTGSFGQYLMSTGIGVTWTSLNFSDSSQNVGIEVAFSGQSTFTFLYNVGYLEVFINGIKLAPSEYTAVDGINIILNTPAFENDIVEFISYDKSSLLLSITRNVGIETSFYGQTSFNFLYKVGFIDVYLNGVKLTESEYTATDGTTVVLNTPAYIDDTVEFISYYSLPFSFLNLIKNVTVDIASEGETTFNFTYRVGFIDVYINGVKLTKSEYTANDGSTVILNIPASDGDIVEFISYYSTLGYAQSSSYAQVSGISTVSQGLTGTPNITVNSINASNLTVSGDSLLSGITTVGVATTSTPPDNSQMSFELISNTQLRIKVRGTDGILRSADITLS